MNPQMPIAEIHTPQAISMWPLAYGWWILLAITVLLLVTIIYQWRKRKAARLAQQLALIELANINLNDFAAGEQINAILKRAAMHYFGREHIAPLSGAKWQNFLVNSLTRAGGKTTSPFDPSWVNFGYTPTVEAQKVIAFHQFAQLWVKQALPGKGFEQQLLDMTANSAEKEPS